MCYRSILFQISFLLLSLSVGLSSYGQRNDGDGTGSDIKVFIPNAFTPNADGLNDVFKPVISGSEIEEYKLRILDRTGSVIFESSEPQAVWNGAVEGSSYTSSPAIFVYFLRIKFKESIKTQTYKGHILMIR
jgi:gliding motility-associated-like protein